MKESRQEMTKTAATALRPLIVSNMWAAHCSRSAQLCLSGEKNRRKKLISQRSIKQVRAVQGRYSGPASQHSCIDLRTYNNCTTTRNQCQTTAMVLEHGQELYFIGLLQWFTEKPELANCWWQTLNWPCSRQSSLLTPRFATPPAAVAARAGQR